MAWRDLHNLFPNVDAKRASGSLTSSLLGDLLGVDESPLHDAPAAVSCAPRAAATSSAADVAPQAGVSISPVGTPAAPSCRAFGCDEPVSSRLTGQCEVHSERWLSDLRHYTRDIGRGTREP